jgi:hypothetical protein
MSLLARVFRPSEPTHGGAPVLFSLSLCGMVSMILNLVNIEFLYFS